jgi:hypothetical protein
MIQRRRSLRLVLEADEPRGVLRRILRQHRDRLVAVQPLIARPVHLPHPAGADLLDEALVVWSGADQAHSSDRFMRSSSAR